MAARLPALSALAALGLLAAAPLAAQSADSTGRAAAVLLSEETVLAETGADRSTYRGMLKQYRALQQVARDYDRQVHRLERHLDSLKTVVAPAMERQIVETDSTTQTLRLRRLALEARLRTLQSRAADSIAAANAVARKAGSQ